MGLRFLTAGESHGPALVAVLDGLPAGLKLDAQVINHELGRRQTGYGAGPRMAIEQDAVQLLGGVMAGETTGAPLALLIENRDHRKWRAKEVAPFTAPRPGHADLSGSLKYAYRDLRPALERASARETAARVAVGAVCKHLLDQFGITIGGYVISIGEIQADCENISYPDRFRLAEASVVRCPDTVASQLMAARVREIMEARDTLGGVIEIAALDVPAGLGSYVQWDRRLEARLGSAVLSVPAIKGVEFGPAFENTRLAGTQVHDPILLDGDDLIRPTNRAGGLEGGITNGCPLIIRAAMKPIATTLNPQKTVDLASGTETPTNYERSDFCPVPRAVPILEGMVAFVLADALLEKLGGDTLAELLIRFNNIKTARLTDLPMDGHSHIYWPET
jgi:chorismate synthase